MSASPRELADEKWAKVGDPSISPKLKRLAGTINLTGAILGAGAIVAMLFTWNGGIAWRTITLAEPPLVRPAFLSFFAIGFGAVGFWALKQVPGKRAARAMGIVSLLLGLAGPPIFTWQAFQLHVMLETGELARAKALTTGALAFREKNGRMPGDLLELVQFAGLGPEAVKTVFGPDVKPETVPEVKPKEEGYEAEAKEFEKEGEFVYAGAGLKELPTAMAGQIMIVWSKHARLSASAAVGFADGSVRWVAEDELGELYKKDDAARAAVGAASRPAMPVKAEQGK